jgi:hypothetical protein
MQYYVWDVDTTGRIIVDRVMKAADRAPAPRRRAMEAPPDRLATLKCRSFYPSGETATGFRAKAT